MSEINVFRRYEIKYLIDYHQRKKLESLLSEYMDPDPHGQSTVCNIYYDTEDFRLIRRSLEKPIYKEKLRVRSYGKVDSGQDVFVELKKKFDGIVYKRRIELPESMATAYLSGRIQDRNALWLPESRDRQIAKEIDYVRSFYPNLAPRVHLSYDRCAYFGKEDPNLRLTFDRHIRWRPYDLSLTEDPGGIDLLDKGHSLMEVKTTTAIPLWLTEFLNKEKIFKANFSKYGKAYEHILKEKQNGYDFFYNNDNDIDSTEFFDKSDIRIGPGRPDRSGLLS